MFAVYAMKFSVDFHQQSGVRIGSLIVKDPNLFVIRFQDLTFQSFSFVSNAPSISFPLEMHNSLVCVYLCPLL